MRFMKWRELREGTAIDPLVNRGPKRQKVNGIFVFLGHKKWDLAIISIHAGSKYGC